MSEFYTGMRGPDAIAKLNQLWSLAGDVSSASATVAAAVIAAQAAEADAEAAAISASSSADTATTQAGAASASATSAANLYDLFDDRYLGAKVSAPTLDNDGATLIAGALYFNTTDSTMYVRTASATWATVNNLASSVAAAASASAASISAGEAAASALAADADATTATTKAGEAAASALAADADATTAATKAVEAAASALAADADATTATTKAGEAAASALAADASALAAANSASAASISANNASISESAAASSAVSALTNKNLARDWAEKATEVETGQYSAKYWAGQAAASVTGQLIYRGAWSAATGSYPATPALGDYYKVSVAGTVSSIAYAVNDSIIYNGTTWDKIDNTEDAGLILDYQDFNTAATATDAVARLRWNDGDGTLDLGLKGGNVTLQLGQEQVLRVLNNTGVSLANGAVVYVTGSQGNRPTVALAGSTLESTSSKTIGMVTEPIANGAEGFIATSGLVRGLNTSSYAEGTTLWLGTSGGLTTTRPAAPLHAVLVGWVTRQHATVGTIFLHIANGYELDELHDVSISGASSGQTLVHNGTTWANGNHNDNFPSVRPTLNLDFANSQTVDPRITFTRASTATRINDRGLVESVASGAPRIDFDPITLACKGLLVEEARTNLLTYSSDFDNVAWTMFSPLTVGSANSVVTPDGSLTADVLTTTNAGSMYLDVTVSGTGTYTASIFVHTSSTCTYAVLSCFLLSNTVETFNIAINPSLGVLFSESPGTTPSVTNVGNGWFRYAISFTGTNALNTFVRFQVYNQTTTANTLVLWGAQLGAGSFPTSYIPSTVTHTGRASTATFTGSNGLIQTAASGAARYSYNPLNLTAAPALLLEAAATNLLTYSGMLGDMGGSDLDTCTATINSAVAPDGTTTAVLLNDSSTTIAGYVQRIAGIAADTATYTYSCYVKQGTAAKTAVSFFALGGSPQLAAGIFTEIEWATGVVTTNGNSGTAVNVGNGWYRLSITYVNTNNTSLYGRVYPAGRPPENTWTGTCYAWGPQLEVGSYPTSYIPTVASQVTRAADTSTSAATTRAADVAVMTGTNFSSWFRADAGTIAVEAQQPAANNYSGTFRQIANISAAATGATQIAVLVNGSNQYSGVVYDNDYRANLYSGTNTGSVFKHSLGYKQDDFAMVFNGQTAITDTSGSMTMSNTLAQMFIGSSLGANPLASFNGHIRSLRYYAKRLTNAELQAITA